MNARLMPSALFAPYAEIVVNLKVILKEIVKQIVKQ
jgi:hypothetical protein